MMMMRMMMMMRRRMNAMMGMKITDADGDNVDAHEVNTDDDDDKE